MADSSGSGLRKEERHICSDETGSSVTAQVSLTSLNDPHINGFTGQLATFVNESNTTSFSLPTTVANEDGTYVLTIESVAGEL